eukprot:9217245-Alexandrium_andersonii.AAC.1
MLPTASWRPSSPAAASRWLTRPTAAGAKLPSKPSVRAHVCGKEVFGANLQVDHKFSSEAPNLSTMHQFIKVNTDAK